jgi:hypothetical protein
MDVSLLIVRVCENVFNPTEGLEHDKRQMSLFKVVNSSQTLFMNWKAAENWLCMSIKWGQIFHSRGVFALQFFYLWSGAITRNCSNGFSNEGLRRCHQHWIAAFRPFLRRFMMEKCIRQGVFIPRLVVCCLVVDCFGWDLRLKWLSGWECAGVMGQGIISKMVVFEKDERVEGDDLDTIWDRGDDLIVRRFESRIESTGLRNSP